MDEHVELAYAQTSHANQGRTVDRSFLFVDGPTDTRGVYVPLTRGRLSNEAFVTIDGEESAVDVLAQALARHWIDEPAVARRDALQERPTSSRDGSADVPLQRSELLALLRRAHAITDDLATAGVRIDMYSTQLARTTDRRAVVARELSEATAGRDQAQQVIDDYDRPLQRRLHRSELGQAQTKLRQSGRRINEHGAELTRHRWTDARTDRCPD